MKTINFTYKGVDYELGFTKATVTRAEKEGLTFALIRNSPFTAMEKLFSASFLWHHKKTKKELISEMYDLMKNTGDLFEVLMECYSESAEELMNGNDSKNAIQWTTNF